MMTEPTEKTAPILALTREMRNDALEREAIQAEGNDTAPRSNGKVKRIPAPDGVWEGSLREFNARPIDKPAELAGLGTVLVTAGAKVVLYGPPSSTKTLLAFRAAIAVALAGGTVWILEGEGHEFYFRDRLNRLARGLSPHGLGEAEDRIRITHKPFVLAEGLAYWRARLAELGPTMIVLDPLVDYSDANENDSKEMRAYLRLVQIATDQFGAAAIVCHHSTKPNDKGRISERGSTAIKGWSDVHIKVLPVSKEGRIVTARMSCEKGRDSAAAAPDAMLEWEFGDAITLGVLEAGPDPVRPDGPATPPPQKPDERAKVDARRTGELVALLGKHAGLMKEEIKDRTGWGGADLNRILDPLFREGRVHMVREVRTNARGSKRVAAIVRLGPAPDPVLSRDPETGSSDGKNPVSEADPVSSRVSDEGVLTDE